MRQVLHYIAFMGAYWSVPAEEFKQLLVEYDTTGCVSDVVKVYKARQLKNQPIGRFIFKIHQPLRNET